MTVYTGCLLACNPGRYFCVSPLNFFYMKIPLTLGLAFFASALFAQTDKIKDYHLNKEYKMNSAGTLKLKCSDARVFISGSDRSTAHVKIDRVVETKGLLFSSHDEFRVDVEEVDGNLEIIENKSSHMAGIVGYYRENYTITVEIPKGASLDVDGDDGDYKVSNLAGTISINLDDADVELTHCSGSDFRFVVDDGDITMDGGRGNLDIDADDADVKISGGAFTSITADMDDGDLIIETSLAENGNYRITAQDGLVALTIPNGGGKFDIRHDDANVLTEGEFVIMEESENRTQLSLAKGTALVDIRADDARVRLINR